MKFPLHVERFEELAELKRELHLAIGMFDGVHRGHRAVIESAMFSAQQSAGVSGVLTFDPHPSRLFRPEEPTPLILPAPIKQMRLMMLGVDIVICKQFDRAFALISADNFLSELKTMLPSLKAVYVGENFRFGKGRAGSVATLIKTGKHLGIDVFSADRIKHNGEIISSTRIRRNLEAGKIKTANDLLGYNYCARGTVTEGEKLGRKIGFPTLNIAWSPECRPRFGVYQVRFRSPEASSWEFGVANYGIRPTVNQTDRNPLLEVHALEGTKRVPDDLIEVEWLHFIRPEQKFESVDLLKEQVAKDCESARVLSGQYG